MGSRDVEKVRPCFGLNLVSSHPSLQVARRMATLGGVAEPLGVLKTSNIEILTAALATNERAIVLKLVICQESDDSHQLLSTVFPARPHRPRYLIALRKRSS